LSNEIGDDKTQVKIIASNKNLTCYQVISL